MRVVRRAAGSESVRRDALRPTTTRGRESARETVARDIVRREARVAGRGATARASDVGSLHTSTDFNPRNDPGRASSTPRPRRPRRGAYLIARARLRARAPRRRLQGIRRRRRRRRIARRRDPGSITTPRSSRDRSPPASSRLSGRSARAPSPGRPRRRARRRSRRRRSSSSTRSARRRRRQSDNTRTRRFRSDRPRARSRAARDSDTRTRTPTSTSGLAGRRRRARR